MTAPTDLEPDHGGPRDAGGRRRAPATDRLAAPVRRSTSAGSRAGGRWVVDVRLRRVALTFLLAGCDLTAFGVALASAGGDMGETHVVWVVLTVALLAHQGAYRTRLTFSVLADAPMLAGRCVAAGALAFVLTGPETSLSTVDLIRRIALVTVSLLVARGLAYAAIRTLRRLRLVAHRTLIIGAGVVGAQIARTAVDRPEFGVEPIGFLDARPLLPDHALAVPVIGDTSELAHVIRARRVEQVIVAFAQAGGSSAVELIRTCDRLECEIFFVPRLFELAAVHGTTEELLGLPLVRLRRAPFRTFAWHLKRLFDIVVAGAALVVMAVPMLAITLALRLKHGPDVIFRQERIGLDGRVFQLAKFRTLRPGTAREGDTRWSIQDDERLDRLGRVLRKWSLDELPQLVNILRGDMSLVGPRPERPYFVEQFAEAFPRYVARHRVPSGLTGWAQIHGLRGDTSIEERVRFDNHYIENWSLWLDVKILLRTALAFRKGS